MQRLSHIVFEFGMMYHNVVFISAPLTHNYELGADCNTCIVYYYHVRIHIDRILMKILITSANILINFALNLLQIKLLRNHAKV